VGERLAERPRRFGRGRHRHLTTRPSRPGIAGNKNDINDPIILTNRVQASHDAQSDNKDTFVKRPASLKGIPRLLDPKRHDLVERLL
jgi:hypothetical protein